MTRRYTISASIVAAAAAGAGVALFSTGAVHSVAATTFKKLPIGQQTLIASRQGITAINRSNAIAGRLGGTVVQDIAAVAFVPREGSREGLNGNGVLAGATNSLYAPLALPEGAKVTAVTLRTRDNDANLNVAARVQRRALAGAYSPTAGLTTVGAVSSSGAADQIRSFATKITANNTVANAQSTLYVELILPSEVNDNLQPLSVQIQYRQAAIKYKKVKLP
jgi:hypothetical protein